ncbi:MAG TPA: tripartite tricarboxylate transporter substrate binding protein [Xanthobacteraceae bacterium]|nr:tripartite tricarboxylate transporter substrate binding protein [Xanthobacteraceae bacterium]
MSRRALIFALAIAVLWPLTARAQDFPNRPIRLIVPFAAGGAADLFARSLANGLGAELGQQVVVEVRAGAGGLTGVDATAKSAPDGYTICLAGAAALSAIPFMTSRMPFDWQKDLSLLTLVVRVPEVLIVHPALGVDTFGDFLAYARARPGKINFGSAGAGSITHLAVELLKTATGIDLVHVPYRGVGPAVGDMLGGHIQVIVADVPFLLPHIRSGALKALAVTSAARVPALPDVPSTAELGYAAVNSDNWYGLVAPAHTPANVLEALRRASLAVLTSAELKKQFESQNALPSPSTPDEFAAFVQAEQAKWGPVVRATGVKLE